MILMRIILMRATNHGTWQGWSRRASLPSMPPTLVVLTPHLPITDYPQ
jgi:hypothetical protein